MTPALDLLRPWALLALPIALGLSWRAWRGSVAGLSPWRSRVVLALRSLLVTALVLALAGARSVRARDEVDVVACLDVSASITAERSGWALEWAKTAARGAL